MTSWREIDDLVEDSWMRLLADGWTVSTAVASEEAAQEWRKGMRRWARESGRTISTTAWPAFDFESPEYRVGAALT